MKKNITEYLQNDKSLIVYRYVILLYYVNKRTGIWLKVKNWLSGNIRIEYKYRGAICPII